MSLYNHRAPYWTRDEDERLVQMWEEGFSAGLIAEQFHNRSRCSIISRARRLGLKGREPVVRRKIENLVRRSNPAPPPVYRDPCIMCGTRGDIGCRHQEAA